MAEAVPGMISCEEYEAKLTTEYDALLADPDRTESEYQSFFEKNPCMLPCYGNMNHGLIHSCLFSQPIINNDAKRRVPDFMWIASNSLQLMPILIEIERPAKSAYRKSDQVQNALFSQAENQILEWKTILEDNKNDFYDRYCIPERLRARRFSPRFILIYGRREEFARDPFLARKRAQKNDGGLELVSFDRLWPSRDMMLFPCGKMKKGKIGLISVPPTLKLGPTIAKDLSLWDGFDEVVDTNDIISPERKDFLKTRYRYWENFGALATDKGVVRTGDWE
ncbi:Shedu anti-phage system protein SduA domain-containing protein [uncultured Adlercreutzia sp.]|nr:Shedu anti-phage system protein SduA domain-containing protein [uncultured Adlercreutzia sp.]